MEYIIGDTIRLEATIKDFAGEEKAPTNIYISIYKSDSSILLDAGVPILVNGTTAQYYYDWEINTDLTIITHLIAMWEWSGPHKKKISFTVMPSL